MRRMIIGETIALIVVTRTRYNVVAYFNHPLHTTIMRSQGTSHQLLTHPMKTKGMNLLPHTHILMNQSMSLHTHTLKTQDMSHHLHTLIMRNHGVNNPPHMSTMKNKVSTLIHHILTMKDNGVNHLLHMSTMRSPGSNNRIQALRIQILFLSPK